MANRYENDPERNRWDRDREHEGDRGRWDRGRENDRWREYGQGSYGSEGGGGYGRGDYQNRGDYWNRGDWNREGDRGEWGGSGRNDWSQSEFGRREQESGRYEGQRSPAYERYGTSSGHWSGGMGSQRGDQFGFRNQMGGIGQSGSQGGYRNDQTGYTGLGSSGWGQYGTYGGGMGQYYGGGRHAGRGPKGYQRSDDRIKEDVNERLTQHPDIDASEIDVQVRNGEVTLTGTVDDRHAKRLAEDVTENVSGVKEVHNQIRVQQQQQNERNVGVAGGTGSTRDTNQFSSHSVTPEPAHAGSGESSRNRR